MNTGRRYLRPRHLDGFVLTSRPVRPLLDRRRTASVRALALRGLTRSKRLDFRDSEHGLRPRSLSLPHHPAYEAGKRGVP